MKANSSTNTNRTGEAGIVCEASKYEVGGIFFLVEPIYSEDGEPVFKILKKLMETEANRSA